MGPFGSPTTTKSSAPPFSPRRPRRGKPRNFAPFQFVGTIVGCLAINFTRSTAGSSSWLFSEFAIRRSYSASARFTKSASLACTGGKQCALTYDSIRLPFRKEVERPLHTAICQRLTGRQRVTVVVEPAAPGEPRIVRSDKTPALITGISVRPENHRRHPTASKGSPSNHSGWTRHVWHNVARSLQTDAAATGS